MKNNKRSVYLKLLAIFVAFNVLTWGIGTFVAYPTAQHRQVIADYSKLTAEAINSGSFDSPEILALEQTSEYQYSKTTDAIVSATFLVAWLVLVGCAYIYLRKTITVKQPVVTTAWLAALGSTLAMLLTLFLGELLYPGIAFIVPGLNVWLQALISIPLTFGFSMLIALIGAGVAKWWHDKRHGFTEG